MPRSNLERKCPESNTSGSRLVDTAKFSSIYLHQILLHEERVFESMKRRPLCDRKLAESVRAQHRC